MWSLLYAISALWNSRVYRHLAAFIAHVLAHPAHINIASPNARLVAAYRSLLRVPLNPRNTKRCAHVERVPHRCDAAGRMAWCAADGCNEKDGDTFSLRQWCTVSVCNSIYIFRMRLRVPVVSVCLSVHGEIFVYSMSGSPRLFSAQCDVVGACALCRRRSTLLLFYLSLKTASALRTRVRLNTYHRMHAFFSCCALYALCFFLFYDKYIVWDWGCKYL